MSNPTIERIAACLTAGNAELDWLTGVFDRYEVGVSEHERGALCEADARTLWGELDDACRSVLALAAQSDLASWQNGFEGLAGKLAEMKDRVREMF